MLALVATTLAAIALADEPCPPPATGLTQAASSVSLTQPADFRVGRTGATAGRILDGAVYDRQGRLVCVLQNHPGAFVTSQAQGGAGVAPGLCHELEQSIAAGNPSGLTPLSLSNDELLRRLIWLYGEGGCQPVARVCPPGSRAADCAAPATPEYASRYYAYTIKNLRARPIFNRPGADPHVAEDQMLRTACNSGHGDGYRSHFVTHVHGNIRQAWPIVRSPRSWGAECHDSSATCRAQQNVSRCISDLIAADLDVSNASSPFGDAQPFGWLGYSGSPSTVAGKCDRGLTRVIVERSRTSHQIHCFRRLD